MRFEAFKALPAPKTLRDLTEWYKQALTLIEEDALLNETEQIFQSVLSAYADKEKVPAGWLIACISILAKTEKQLVAVAKKELDTALEYGGTDGGEAQPEQG